MSIEEIYKARYDPMLLVIAGQLEIDLKRHLKDVGNIDRISTRSKSIDRFLKKSKKKDDKGSLKYNDPLSQIQDQIGARVVVFYLSDIEIIESKLKKYYRAIEEQTIVPDSEKEFGYEGKHFIFLIPSAVIPEEFEKSNPPVFFELQIKTLYQHAWSEASHDIAYKSDKELSKDNLRKIAFTSAQSWGADNIFNSLYND